MLHNLQLTADTQFFTNDFIYKVLFGQLALAFAINPDGFHTWGSFLGEAQHTHALPNPPSHNTKTTHPAQLTQ